MTRFAGIGLNPLGFGAWHGSAAPLRDAPPPQRAVILGVLGLLSAVLSYLTFDVRELPYPLLPGIWFALVLAAGVWLWAPRGKIATAVIFAATNAAWWAAFETSVRLYSSLEDISALPAALSGVASGFVGSFVTVCSVSYACPGFRTGTNWVRTLAAGSLAGILLEAIDLQGGSLLPLLLVWQGAVAASIGWGLTAGRRSR
jgi:hypothetical protein